MSKKPKEDAEEVEIRSRADLRNWLKNNNQRTQGIWLVHYKKAVPEFYVAMGEIVDECLCFGWVDSLTRGKDDQRTMHWIAPRNPKSNWSRVNKDKIASLVELDLMAPAGLAMVETAKKNGSWVALDDVENLIIPMDLQAAFDASSGAEGNWHAFPRSVKRGALEILTNAKRPATRQSKVETIVSDSAQNQRPFQWTRK